MFYDNFNMEFYLNFLVKFVLKTHASNLTCFQNKMAYLFLSKKRRSEGKVIKQSNLHALKTGLTALKVTCNSKGIKIL